MNRRFLLAAAMLGLALGAGTGGLVACSALDASDGGVGGDGGGGDASSASGTSDASIDVAPDAEQPPGPLTYAEHCGEGACVPGALLDPCLPAGGEGGGGAGQGGGGGGGGGGTTPGAPTTCRITSDDGVPMPVCAPLGAGALNAPCLGASDCAAGLGCVPSSEPLGEGGAPPTAGLCKPYCCGELEACPSSTYCGLAPMVEDPALPLPVCLPTEPCQLLTEASCPQGESCTVVRADGSTSCVPVGAGEACDACPCADGFVCAPATGTCLRLCRTDVEGECGAGTCQGGTLGTPTGIGVCVGGENACP